VSTTQHIDDAVETYIEAVRAGLTDVPEEDRVELLEDVAGHVREIADEFGPEDLEARLGTPQQFTEELRASAGYGPIEEVVPEPAPRISRVRVWLDDHVRTEANRALWRKLEPGWFAVRGAAIVYVLVSAVHAPEPVGFAAIVAGAVASLTLGDRRVTQPKWISRARIAGEVAFVVFAVVLLHNASHRVQYIDYGGNATQFHPCLRDSGGRPIGNLYAFDRAGQAIPQFFLTDENGRPIDNLCPDQSLHNGKPVQTDYAHDVNGAPVYGVFPRKQVEATPIPTENGVTITTTPVAPPAVVFPQLAPPTTEAPAQPQP
jgi:hypothetical protein